VERAIGYVRQNFWPLRSFTSLADVNAQARQWLKEVANRRKHRETSQAPDERFQPESLKPLPAMVPDYRDAAEALVHKDIRLSFDGNRYCVPPRYVGHKLTVKADASSVTIYDQHQEVARYARSWERGRHSARSAFRKSCSRKWLPLTGLRNSNVWLLCSARRPRLIWNGLPIRTVQSHVRSARLFVLIREYGPEAVASAIAKAHAARAFGADYVGNILRQQQQRREVQPPLLLKNPALNQLATDPLSLAEYDAFILRPRKEPHELTATETEPTQPDIYESPAGPGDR
jgi:hypothetical protein